jgi:hypothetical protein
MNKGQGATTIGAILLAGLMFRGTANPGAQEGPSAASKQSTAQQSEVVTGEGPWLASCKYWAAALPPHAEVAKDKAPVLDIKLNQTGKTIESHVTASVSSENCSPGTDGWGIPPNTGDEHNPEISTIIATVPDPIHSDLSLDFDRTIDAILLAAAENHYLSSFYWLPWHARSAAFGSAEPSGASDKPDRDKSREQQPGLIILRYAPDPIEWQREAKRQQFSRASFHRVIYLFLVGETPRLGVNGTQLQNALTYEDGLVTNHQALLSIRPSPFATSSTQTSRILSVIGPLYSGSAASLHEGLKARPPNLGGYQLSISGITSTQVAAHELDPDDQKIYRSFGENTGFDQEAFLDSLCRSGFDLGRVAVLSEANTVFGSAATPEKAGIDEKDIGESGKDRVEKSTAACKKTVLSLEFPREISLLRNAQNSQAKPDSSAPTPYLNLSLKDISGDDALPRFSTTQSPLSIEAQLMAIAHQLERSRTQFIFLSASNILDEIFLVQFLRRACPDARLVIFNGGDLLFERDVDNAPYIGSLSISSYPLTSLDFGSQVQWLHSDYQSEAVYNATNYVFWDKSVDKWPHLAGYRRYPVPNPDPPKGYRPPPVEFLQVPLWISAVGSDGYYPLAVLDWCGSKSDTILPTISLNSKNVQQPCIETKSASFPESGTSKTQHVWDYVPESINSNSSISPSFLWGILAAVISFACIGHAVLFLSADYWSPFTRDLDIDHNDQPHRRAVYLNIGTSVLASMAFITAWPLIVVHRFYKVTSLSLILVSALLLSGIIAVLVTLSKTRFYLYRKKHREGREYSFFNLVALGALVFNIVTWILICNTSNSGDARSYAGLFFSYRCLRPLTGVCPLIPVLLLLLAWFLWSICQTARLRFSYMNRPHLPGRVASQASPSRTPYPLYVPDQALEDCCRPVNSCLYDNIITLLITRAVLRRFLNNLNNRNTGEWCEKHVNWLLGTIYLVLFLLWISFAPVRSLDRALFPPVLQLLGDYLVRYRPTLYESLVVILFFPLLMIALSGWLRVILIWGALSRGLLEPLERVPIRFAFTRLKGGSWMSMFRQSGLHIRWREMSRSTESIRQLINHHELKSKAFEHLLLSRMYEDLNLHIRQIMERIPATCQNAPKPSAIDSGVCPPTTHWDRPTGQEGETLCLLYSMDKGYAAFCQSILEMILVPHWDQQRTGLVEDSNYPGDSEIPKSESKEDGKERVERRGPTLIRLAEELLVIRYIALIRAVLVNIRYLMLFVSASFVLALVAWNTYPFQPRAFIDWCFTVLLVVISVGFITVFAQVHRNAILSRITDTKPNELGWDFYIRIITFGGVPVLTWLAYEFPQIGGSLFKILQPGLQVVK